MPHNNNIIVNFVTEHTILDFINAGPQNLTINQSRRAEFHCSVRSTFIPNFVWNFSRKGSSTTVTEVIANKSGPLSADISIIAGQRGQVLIITNVQLRHEGVYTCIVSSENSQIQVEANLNVFSM